MELTTSNIRQELSLAIENIKKIQIELARQKLNKERKDKLNKLNNL